MEVCFLFLKGFLIGLGKMLPGVSGGLIAMSFHVYEKGVYSLTHLKEKESILFLINIGSGMLLAMIISSHFILSFLEKNDSFTISFFIGLLCGSFPSFYPKTKKQFGISFLSFLFLFLVPVFPQVSFGNQNFISLFLIGIMESLTILIPGISGTALLMTLGYYSLILSSIASFHLSILLPFFIGIISGCILFLRQIEKFLERKKESFPPIIFGFSIASILFLSKPFFFRELGITHFFCLFFGYFLSSFFEKTSS